MIPVLGVPVLNRPDFLFEMIESIDYPVQTIIVVDNGAILDTTDPEVLRRLRPPTGPDDGRTEVIRLPHNVGVAVAWNLIFKVTPSVPWWCIVNSDLTFGPGDLANLTEAMTARSGPVLQQLLGLAAFGINNEVLERVGYFDENFHPAYCEDVDYVRRCHLAGIETPSIVGTLKHRGSATIFNDESYRLQNAFTYGENRAYYRSKWGGDVDGTERFETPFNNGGSEPPIQPSRFRELAWKRSER